MSFNRALSFIGGPRPRTVLVAIIVVVLAIRRQWRSVAMLVTATGGMGTINTAIKLLVRRQRPRGIPGLKQAGGYSFPSGHSSGSVVFLGALAFLTWTITRNRILTSIVAGAGAVLAALIGRSRVVLKAHHWSDVFSGFALGLVWLGLILRLFARPLARERRSGAGTDPLATQRRPRPIVLVANPMSGRAGRALEEIRSCLAEEQLYVLETISMEQLDRLRPWVEKPEAERPLIVAAGGDGTIGSVAAHVVDTPAVLGILPAGTSNDIARSLEIPLKIKDAVRVLADGEVATIDIGRFQVEGEEKPRYFIHAATAGINVAFARLATQASFRKRLGHFTYLVAGLIALEESRPFDCELDVDGRRVSLSLLQLCIVNAPVFGGLLHLALPESSIADHQLDVLAVEELSVRSLLRTGLRLLLGRRKPIEGLRLFHAQNTAVSSSESQAITLDGEIAATIPGSFSLRTEGLRVILPRPVS
jgi:YegS/Rv2252/BmrU family lipid kinase